MTDHPFYPTPEQLRAKQADRLEMENDALRAALAATEAKLADAEKHADELADALAWIDAERGTDEGSGSEYEAAVEEMERMLAAHAARRAARDGQEGTR